MSILKSSLQSYLGTTSAYLELLKELKIELVEDLLLYYPRTYEDQSQFQNLLEGSSDHIITLKGIISDLQNQVTKNRKHLTKAIFTDDSGQIAELVWFNQRYLKNTIPQGQEVIVTGKVRFDFGRFSIQSPTVEIQQKDQLHTGRIVPVYREHGKITSRWLREKIAKIIHYTSLFPENLPLNILKEEELMERALAITNIHFPESAVLLSKARDRLAFEELFQIQKGVLSQKKQWQDINPEQQKIIKMEVDFIKAFFEILPFSLTQAQKIVLYEILRDLEKPIPMSRLLEGDVGSGKTVVIVAAITNVFKNGYQSAIMAPTEVLARQHFATVTKLFNEFTKHQHYQSLMGQEKKINQSALELFSSFLNQKLPTIELLTGSVIGKKRQAVLSKLENGEIDVIIGTHALIQENIKFHKLGFVVVDEQHRFGVEQRDRLKAHGCPHVLSMSATPIPRSLALTAYGDQDLSVINEMPPGRKAIISKVVPERERMKVYQFVQSEVKKGRQGYVICPLIDESDVLEVKSAVKEYEFLKLDIFPELRIGLMHGRLNPGEKEYVMRQFKEHQLDILVSTSVIEVGIDVPNATMMMIEGAERFGLAQLHQFRGRVGRGEQQSYAFLFTDSKNQASLTRLKYMEKYTDGFKLAEIDLRLRGPGEVYGLKQSGIPDLRMASLNDAKMIYRVRQCVEKMLFNN
jgi:ATP-dependent DNA helicase RecG